MIIVFGSINVDFVMRAPVLPAPGETVLGGSYFLAQGGKGANQACAAALAGADTVLVGSVGDDDWGRFALERLRAAGVALDTVARVRSPTGCASILVDEAAENAIVVASGANLEVSAAQVPAALLGPGAVVVTQMEVPAAETWAVIEHAAAAGARVVLNVAPAAAVPATVLDAVDVLIVNEHEAVTVAGALGLAARGPEALACALADTHELACIVTLGGAGVIGAAPGTALRVGALPVEPVDTTGAGDAFTGVLAAALDAGAPLAAAVHRASVGAALACTRPGAQPSYAAGGEITAAGARLSPAVVRAR